MTAISKTVSEDYISCNNTPIVYKSEYEASAQCRIVSESSSGTQGLTMMRCETFPSRLESLPNIYTFVRSFFQTCGITNGHLKNRELAVDEAASNIIKYAYSDQEGSLRIYAMESGDDIRLVLQDSGNPFDPTSVHLPDIQKLLENRLTSGLGVFLMRRFTDQIQYERTPNGLNLLTLIWEKNQK